MKKILIRILPILLGSLILFRWHQNTLVLYVAARYIWLVAGGGAILIGLGIWSFFRSHAVHHVAHDTKNWQIIAITLPLFFGSILPPQPLSAQTAVQRGLAQTKPSFIDPAPFSFAVDSAQRSFGDWARIISATPDLSRYDGEEINIKGFAAYHENTLYLTRFQVACCAADARPIGLEITTQQTPPENSWWNITGTIHITPEGDFTILPTQLTPIDIPQNPYL